jgi:hypothetical protein
MLDSYDPQFVADHLNGQASEMRPMVNLMAQVFVILVVGIALWRISAIFGRKTRTRKQTMFGDSRYQKHWQNKR